MFILLVLYSPGVPTPSLRIRRQLLTRWRNETRLVPWHGALQLVQQRPPASRMHQTAGFRAGDLSSRRALERKGRRVENWPAGQVTEHAGGVTYAPLLLQWISWRRLWGCAQMAQRTGASQFRHGALARLLGNYGSARAPTIRRNARSCSSARDRATAPLRWAQLSHRWGRRRPDRSERVQLGSEFSCTGLRWGASHGPRSGSGQVARP